MSHADASTEHSGRSAAYEATRSLEEDLDPLRPSETDINLSREYRSDENTLILSYEAIPTEFAEQELEDAEKASGKRRLKPKTEEKAKNLYEGWLEAFSELHARSILYEPWDSNI